MKKPVSFWLKIFISVSVIVIGLFVCIPDLTDPSLNIANTLLAAATYLVSALCILKWPGPASLLIVFTAFATLPSMRSYLFPTMPLYFFGCLALIVGLIERSKTQQPQNQTYSESRILYQALISLIHSPEAKQASSKGLASSTYPDLLLDQVLISMYLFLSLLILGIGIGVNVLLFNGSWFNGSLPKNFIFISSSILFFIPLFTIEYWPGFTSVYLLILAWTFLIAGNFPFYLLLLAGVLSIFYAILKLAKQSPI